MGTKKLFVTNMWKYRQCCGNVEGDSPFPSSFNFVVIKKDMKAVYDLYD
jgi:hypothetical protein